MNTILPSIEGMCVCVCVCGEYYALSLNILCRTEIQQKMSLIQLLRFGTKFFKNFTSRNQLIESSSLSCLILSHSCWCVLKKLQKEDFVLGFKV
jgi:hypothetical protein